MQTRGSSGGIRGAESPKLFLGTAHRNISFATMTEHLAPHSRPACDRWASGIGPLVPFALANGYVERLIGSMPRECIDHMIAFNEEHLLRILSKCANYYNDVRTHVSLGEGPALHGSMERFGDIIPYPILRGLHQRYARI